MLKTIPHNMNYHIGNDLREVPEEPEAFRLGIAWLEQKLAMMVAPEEKGIGLSLLGVLQRIVGDLPASLRNLEAAANWLDAGSNPRAWLINACRMAQTLQFMGEYKRADASYAELVADMRATQDAHQLLDFILQHQGKSFFEQGSMQAAENSIQEALQLRRAKGNPDLIASSTWALKIIRAHPGE